MCQLAAQDTREKIPWDKVAGNEELYMSQLSIRSRPQLAKVLRMLIAGRFPSPPSASSSVLRAVIVAAKDVVRVLTFSVEDPSQRISDPPLTMHTPVPLLTPIDVPIHVDQRVSEALKQAKLPNITARTAETREPKISTSREPGEHRAAPVAPSTRSTGRVEHESKARPPVGETVVQAEQPRARAPSAENAVGTHAIAPPAAPVVGSSTLSNKAPDVPAPPVPAVITSLAPHPQPGLVVNNGYAASPPAAAREPANPAHMPGVMQGGGAPGSGPPSHYQPVTGVRPKDEAPVASGGGSLQAPHTALLHPDQRPVDGPGISPAAVVPASKFTNLQVAIMVVLAWVIILLVLATAYRLM